jgi:tRNA (adenine22-N1)-methyltransferase
MKLKLSKRLLTTANMLTPGLSVADIGCDHAYTSIYLMQSGKAKKVIAMDINEGPLKMAKENIRLHHMEDVIETRLSNGAMELKPGEVEAFLISGMGGPLICSILQKRLDLLPSVKELILQPQSEVFEVRHFLHDHGFAIEAEDMVFDEGKYYVIIKARPGIETYEEEVPYIYGAKLMESKNPVWIEYMTKERNKLEKVLSNLPDTEKTMARRQELRDVCRQLDDLLQKK